MGIQLATRSIRSARDTPAVYSSLAFLYTARDSVYQISARLHQLCTARSPFSIQLATRSIRSARDCTSCVQLARLSLYSSRLGLSDQSEIAPAVYSSLAFLYTARDSVYQ